jgi:HPt (histidine-containing phosphotransfer) domain-containing protein
MPTVKRILQSFVGRSDKTLQAMQDAAALPDYIKLRREAHSLKGGSGYIACDRLFMSAKALQLATDAVLEGGTPETPVETCLQRLREDMQIVCDSIRVFLDPAVSGS